jgi:plastocyanin
MLAVGLSSIACAPAFGANQTVTATAADTFTPNPVTVVQGDTVTWTNGGGNHNVHFDDDSFVMPPTPSTDAWVAARPFSQIGSFRYYCEVHGGPGGNGMSGTVVVNPTPPGGGGGGGGTPGPGPAPGPGADTAPVSSLVGPAKQDVDKLFVRASMNEAGVLTATGTVSVAGGAAKAYTLKRVSRAVTAGQTVKLRLKLRKQALKAVKRALLRGRKVRAKITLTAKDATGKETRRKRTVRLTR